MLQKNAVRDAVNGRSASRGLVNGFACPRPQPPEGSAMAWIIKKYLLTAGIVILVSELAKRSDMLGCLVAALSLVTVLTLVWLYLENQSMEKISNHAWYTFLYVLPTLPMFIAFPLLLPKLGFWPTLISSILITMASFGVFTILLRRFGIELL